MYFLRKTIFLLAGCLAAWDSSAQNADSLLMKLAPADSIETPVTAFKSTRVVLSHSSETQKKHDLDLRIRHHFGDIGGRFGGSHTLFGLDAASDLFIGLDYGISDRFTAGIGRSRQNELYDVYLKYKLIQQLEKRSPIALTVLVQPGLMAREPFTDTEFSEYSNRLSYLFQAVLSRKFSNALSMEILPSYLVRSQAADPMDNNNLFSLGFAGRLKLSKRFSFVADYQLVNAFGRPDDLAETHYNPLGVGLEIETGGHIFSLNFMNSEYILENNFLPDTKKSWNHGGVRFGFTISRNFTLFKSKNPDVKTRIY